MSPNGGTDAWQALQPPVWIPFLWWTALVVSMVVSGVTDPGAVCTVQQPCAPDRVFPLVVALMAISLLTTWWLPVTGLAAGGAYAVLGVLFDPSLPGRYAEGVVGCLALALLSMITRLRTRQAAVADGRQVPAWQPSPPPPYRELRRTRLGVTAAIVMAVGAVGVMVLLASVAGYVHQTGAERAHLSRAQSAQGRVVTSTDDDYRQVFEIESGARTGDRISIEVTNALPRGSAWPVLIDPDDREWARLPSEPHGVTFWLGWALLGGTTSVWCLGYLLARRRSAAARGGPVSHQLVRLSDDGRAKLLLGGGTQATATVALAGLPAGLRRSRDAQEALVRGPVHDGGWVAIQTALGPLAVDGPIRAVERWQRLPGNPLDHVEESVAWRRLELLVRLLWRALILAFACLMAWFGLHQLGPAWAAAHDRGVTGMLTVTSESCGKSCSYTGDFRSTDGQLTFPDVELIGGRGDVGSAVPAFYEDDGGVPDAVYAPGWGGVTESLFFVGVAIGTAGWGLLGLLELAAVHRRPPKGRHAR